MTVTFTGLASVADRTIYTKKGPIVKRPLVLMSGSNLAITSETEIYIPTGPFNQSHVGKKLRISGSPSNRNDGQFTIERVTSASRALLSGCSFNIVNSTLTTQSVIQAANALKAAYNHHTVQDSVHFQPDTAHPVTASQAYDLASSITLLNNIKAQFALHVVTVGSGPVHNFPDAESVPLSIDAYDINSAVLLANELMQLFRQHRDNGEVHQNPDLVNRVLVPEVRFLYGGPNAGPFNWSIVDLRTGQIADDPSDVTVSVNNAPAVVEAVFGLLGAVVLATKPTSGQPVTIDYDYLTNPPTQMQRLNSPEFNLNQVGNRGSSGYPGHQYRSRAYLIKPSQSSLTVKSPVSPKQKGWKYKGFQRAYSAVLNDPNSLLLNVPTNKLAKPVLDKHVTDAVIKYDPTSLPNNSTDPWDLKGTGTLSLAPGGAYLRIQDSTDMAGVKSDPPFFTHAVDLSFPSAVLSAFRMSATCESSEGVFAGPAFGISDGQKASIVGLLLTESTNLSSAIVMANDIRSKYSKHLLQTGVHRPNDTVNVVTLLPAHDLPSLIVLLSHLKSVFNSHIASAFHQTADSIDVITTSDPKSLDEAINLTNEIKSKFDAHRTQTGVHYVNDLVNAADRVRQVGMFKGGAFDLPESWECEAVDWSAMTTYRLQRGINGRCKLFIGGAVFPIADLLLQDLPAASDVDIQIDPLHQIFFGSIGKVAKSTSDWAFLRVRIVPAQEHQIIGSKSVTYTPVNTPELDAIFPWITIGQSGYERIQSGKLLVDSTASAPIDEVQELGLVTGAYRGFLRYEPSLTRNAVSSFEFTGSVPYSTFSIDNKSAGVFLDDGSIAVHLLYIESCPTPATVVGTKDEPFQISGGETLIISLDGSTPVTITFPLPITSAAAVASVINSTPGAPSASVVNSRLVLTDTTSGADSKLEVLGGTAVDRLGIQVGTYFGKDAKTQPRISWFGASFPDEDTPKWVSAGNAEVDLYARTLRISDSDTSNFRAYSCSDPLYTKSTLDSDWKLDFRAAVLSYVAGDPVVTGSNLKFCGGLCSIDEGASGKNVEIQFAQTSAGSPYINVLSYSSTSDNLISVAEYPFAWNDGKTHSFNLFATKSSDVCLFLADGVALGTFSYSGLQTGASGPSVTFGSGGNPVSNCDLMTAQSVIDWSSVAVFVSANDPAVAPSRRYVGLYKGGDATVLSSYYLHQIDWSSNHTYRIVRDPQGSVSVYVDGSTVPSISANYDSLSLPPSDSSFLASMTGMRNVVAFGSFNPSEISRTSWGNIRYSIGELSLSNGMVSGRQVINTGHVIASPEHLTSNISHKHYNTRVYSGGTPDDDFMARVDVIASTILGEGTPPVPMTEDLASRGGLQKVVTTVSTPDSADFVNVKGFLTDLEDDSANLLTILTAPVDTTSSIAVLNEVKLRFNKHLTQYRVHVANNLENSVVVADCFDLSTACALANAIKVAMNAHLIATSKNSPVHTTNDLVNMITSPDAVDPSTLVTLSVEIFTKYTAHLSQTGVHGSSIFIRLDAPSRVLYDRMKFFTSESGEDGLLAPFSDDESDI